MLVKPLMSVHMIVTMRRETSRRAPRASPTCTMLRTTVSGTKRAKVLMPRARRQNLVRLLKGLKSKNLIQESSMNNRNS